MQPHTFWSLWFIICATSYVCCMQNTTAENRKGYCIIESDDPCLQHNRPVSIRDRYCAINRKDNETTCCSNYQLVEEKCIECDEGTFRIDGPKCKDCKDGFFGRFCGMSCRCDKCHPVDGSCCSDNGNDCSSSEIHVGKKNTRENAASQIYITVLVPGMVLLICVLIFLLSKGMYDKFQRSQQMDLTGLGTGKKIIMCLMHCMQKPKQRPGPSTNVGVSFNTSCEDDEDHYCDIRDSAIIQRFNSCNVSLDLTNDKYEMCADEYNHLALGPATSAANVYNTNIYTKVKFVNGGRKAETDVLPNYDTMELERN